MEPKRPGLGIAFNLGFWGIWSLILLAAGLQIVDLCLHLHHVDWRSSYHNAEKLELAGFLLFLGGLLGLAAWILAGEKGLQRAGDDEALREARGRLRRKGSLALLALLFVMGGVYFLLPALGIYDPLDYRMVTCGKVGNETGAEKALKTLVDAESNFRKADYDGDGPNYCCELAKLYYLTDGAGRRIALIPRSLAHGTKEGYTYGTIPCRADGCPVDRRDGFAYYGIPTLYGSTGRRSCIVNEKGVIWYKDQGRRRAPPHCWPVDPAKEGWTALRE